MSPCWRQWRPQALRPWTRRPAAPSPCPVTWAPWRCCSCCWATLGRRPRCCGLGWGRGRCPATCRWGWGSGRGRRGAGAGMRAVNGPHQEAMECCCFSLAVAHLHTVHASAPSRYVVMAYVPWYMASNVPTRTASVRLAGSGATNGACCPSAGEHWGPGAGKGWIALTRAGATPSWYRPSLQVADLELVIRNGAQRCVLATAHSLHHAAPSSPVPDAVQQHPGVGCRHCPASAGGPGPGADGLGGRRSHAGGGAGGGADGRQAGRCRWTGGGCGPGGCLGWRRDAASGDARGWRRHAA